MSCKRSLLHTLPFTVAETEPKWFYQRKIRTNDKCPVTFGDLVSSRNLSAQALNTINFLIAWTDNLAISSTRREGMGDEKRDNAGDGWGHHPERWRPSHTGQIILPSSSNNSKLSTLFCYCSRPTASSLPATMPCEGVSSTNICNPAPGLYWWVKSAITSRACRFES